jgi:hypothetical protein
MFGDIFHDRDLVNKFFFSKGDSAQNWEQEDYNKLFFNFYFITAIECALRVMRNTSLNFILYCQLICVLCYVGIQLPSPDNAHGISLSASLAIVIH